MTLAFRQSDSQWTVDAPAERDAGRILRVLEREPLLNTFLISRIRDEGTASSNMLEVRHRGEMIIVASVATNIVLAADRRRNAEEIQTAFDHLARRIIDRSIPVRAIVSEADLVESLWQRIQQVCDPPTVARLNQPIYALERNDALPDLQRVRYSTVTDLPTLVPSCAAMHLEEVGINPLDRDAYGYRERVRELVIGRRSLVLMEGKRIAFKCEFSAVTPDAAQLMGVWTAPPLRRRGYAKIGMREVCGHLLRNGRKVTLFVNDFNTAAIALYEGLGFRRIGTNRALIW